MKQSIIIFIAIISLLMAGCSKKKEDSVSPGSIYGAVTDKATGDCVSAAGVELMPKGLKTVTGSDGSFQFTHIDPGDYNLFITKTGYQDLKSSTITVKSGETAKGDVQIDKLPSVLRIVNGDGEDISDLEFGAENDVTSRTFSIFNDSPRRITWWIEENCSWIIEVKSMLNNEQSGAIAAGEQEPIKVTIDRDALGLGLKSYILNINSDNGSKELLITAGADVGLPALTTDPVSNLTQYSVTFNGTIINGGTPVYTERGFVYSTNPQPTIDNNLGKIVSGINGQASYSANLNELTPNTTYYVSAYAINPVGVAYGEHVQFTTSAGIVNVITNDVTEITLTSAMCGGTLTLGNGNTLPVTGRGVCWSINHNPTISDNHTSDGTGIGQFTSSITELTLNTNYYVRAYATNELGTYYGEEKNFTTNNGSILVSTKPVTNIASTSAECGGTITIPSGNTLSVTARGVCWSTSHNPTTTDDHTSDGIGDGSYTSYITGLTLNTNYYVRAYATNQIDTYYGNEVSFTTTNGLPTVVTITPTLNNLTVTSGGNVTSDGGYPVLERGICYSTVPNPDLSPSHNHTSDGNGTGTYASSFAMSEVGKYYIRAYATNSVGTIYGEQKEINHPYYGLQTFTLNGHTYRLAPFAPTTMNWSDANSYCNDLTLYGYSDWRLPTGLEIEEAYNKFFTGYEEIWSSNECNDSGLTGHSVYWKLGFSTGDGCREDNNLYYVRPVRVEN